ncbi:hypothetical protein QYE76_010804 [Lolium multiflorum]|uniref:Uncharacterized protein n=1 Tax=Lolium multiflorum TaxID=4521 RepID=A0AAD8TXY9_LOLMU|nr:hypothetical protein QYE76_010804 [Lolium multiflorum]
MDSAILKRECAGAKLKKRGTVPVHIEKSTARSGRENQQTLETKRARQRKYGAQSRRKPMQASADADAETSADTNMVFILPSEFRAPSDEEVSVAQFDCGPRPVIFEKPRDRSYRHLKALYLRGYINGQPVSKMLVDTGAAVNIMPYSMLRRLGHSSDDLIKTNITLSDFNGQASEAKGVLNVELTVGRKTIPTAFFIVDSKSNYAVLLGRDWIHANCCIPYSFMEGHTQWMSDDGDDDIDGDGDDDGGDDDNEGDGEDAPHDNGDEVEEDGAHVDGDQEGREEHAADEDMSRNTPLTAAVQDRHVQELLLSNTSTDPKIAGRRKAKLDQLEVDSRTPLYDAARGTEESRLRYALDIMEMKAKHKWTDTSVDELFGYLKIHFPKDNTCAGSLQEAKKIVCPLDLPHQKYHACISDCVIYRNEHANLDTCPQCGESRYKRGTKKSPRKVVWYFPLTPRLQRYFVDPKEAKLMRWHAERKEAVMRDVERVENPVLTHPSDASQWKTLDDEYYEEFGKEPRNIRLGASTDGLNPFGNQSSKHSTWPVFVWMYNLPPWLCLKKKYIHMSMLIQGPTQPGSDINLYLELLKEELVTLWEEGIETWDAYGQETFRMKAALLTTVQDYLGYGYIACQVCHGHKACVRCMEKTPFLQLGKDPGSSKTVYMRHRMWLPKNDPWRKRGDLFNGKDEVEGPPPRRSGEEIDTLLKNWKDCPPAGKIKIQKRKKGDKRKKKEPGPLLGVWKRRSVFWDLPYWKILGTPHSLDVMHITKNVCESLLGTVLNMPERTKDGSKARHDLMALHIRKELHFAQVDQETEEDQPEDQARGQVARLATRIGARPGGFAAVAARGRRSPSRSGSTVLTSHCPPVGFDVNTFWHARWDTSSTTTTSPSTSEMAEETPVTYGELSGELKKKYDEVKVLLEADLIDSSLDTRSHGVSTNVVELGYHPGEGSDEGGCSHSKGEEEADPSDRIILHAPPALPVFGVDLTGDGKLGFGFTSADELEEVDIGPGDRPRPTFISRKLDPQLRSQMIALLKEYPDCFAWDYTEMPGLDRSIIEHRLPLKKGFRPFQQRARQMKAEILEEVKKEIEKMLAAGFIRPCRYAEWISSIVPVEKKDGRWRVAIDFRDLNRATPKDEYPMPVAETLINAAAGHKVLSFMDGNAGYNQIFMAPEDIHKTAFRVPGAVGLFEYVVMTFGLKNAGATYQRAMNYIFHDLIGKLVEIYIDDVVVKSVSMKGHLEDLRHVLDRTRKFGLRMNPKKCAFGVTAGQFLGFLVHERGIEIGLKSQEAVRTMQPPTTKKELQRLIGKINFVRRFISNLSGRIEPFMGLVKTKSDDEFHWGAEQQQAFDDIKRYLTTPPVLVPPQQDRPFYIYLSVADTSIASVVVQLYDGVERVVFYLSRRMLDAETRYPEVEKLCLCLFFTCTKLHHILLTAEIFVICKSDVVKHMLSAPVLKGRLGKWMLALSEFDLRYQPAKAVKGQALADLIAERINTNIAALSIRAWAMLSTPCTNNVAEYEAIRKGMELLLEAGAEAVELFGDSKLVINQLTDEYKCESESLFPYWMECRELMAQFRYINFNWVPRSQNTEANNLAQMASGYIDTPEGSEVQVQFLEQDDWRAEIFKYLKDSARGAPKRVRYKAMKYVLIGDDMFYRTLEGLLLKCLGPTESNRLLHEVHEGACGTHQSAHKMKWLIRRSGFYWPTMLEDCFNYYKGCQACQMFGKIQMVPASAMNPIIKPWPFRGWGMDMIGKIHPASSKKHEFILAITDYFTKWVEAVPMKKVKSEDVIKFVKEHVIHRFGIPQTITTDGGSVFVSKEFRGFCDDMGIKLIRSSPYYAQANGQAEASNQSLIKLIKRKIEENPRDWHEKLSEALWAYRMSCHGAIKTSPYQLVYGQEAVLPWEITAGSRRVTFQDDLTADEYATLMSDTIEDATELRLWSLEKIKENKARVARAYNKKVRPKEFQVGDLVWEAVLPLGTRDKAYGKWSPNWHGPYKVVQALKGNAYMLEELDGQKFPVAVNGQHLKKYFPSMWDDGH